MPQSLAYFDTEYSADSTEFCPYPGAQDVLAVGTYQLMEKTETSPMKRLGRCYVFSVGEDESLLELQRFDLPAILDMKWHHNQDVPILAIADSEGHIGLYLWDFVERQLSLQQRIDVTDNTTLCLSLDWSNRVDHSGEGSIVVSTSDGNLSIISPEFEVTKTWKAHEFEPWIAAWDYWSQGQVIFSGGDDCRFKGWDLRAGVSSPIFTNKGFEAGVTSIQSHPHLEHMLAVGSYDATVRLFDARKTLTPLLQMDVGGGVWRVKWHPSERRKNDLLVACMHDGFKVLRMENTRSGLVPENYETVQRFDEHKSLAYGADWSYGAGDTSLIASCSFYDHLLHTWRA